MPTGGSGGAVPRRGRPLYHFEEPRHLCDAHLRRLLRDQVLLLANPARATRLETGQARLWRQRGRSEARGRHAVAPLLESVSLTPPGAGTVVLGQPPRDLVPPPAVVHLHFNAFDGPVAGRRGHPAASSLEAQEGPLSRAWWPAWGCCPVSRARRRASAGRGCPAAADCGSCGRAAGSVAGATTARTPEGAQVAAAAARGYSPPPARGLTPSDAPPPRRATCTSPPRRAPARRPGLGGPHRRRGVEGHRARGRPGR
eukprot:scaffold19867_cov56-Phaeocystis_antarctica.AAC.7